MAARSSASWAPTAPVSRRRSRCCARCSRRRPASRAWRASTSSGTRPQSVDEAEYCDRIAIIDRGKIVALGTPDELKAMVGGDVVTITSTAPGAAAKEIEDMLGVKPARDNGTLRMEVPDGKAFVPRLVRELSAPVDTVTLRRPSLDDVFLKLTGRAIRDEEVSARDRNRAMASRWMGRRR